MKFITKIWMGCAVIGALIGVYYADKYKSSQKEDEIRQLNFAVWFEPSEVLEFKLENSENTLLFKRQNNTSPWRMSVPKQTLAENERINDLLFQLSKVPVHQELTPNAELMAGNPIELAKYGLLKPALTLSLTLKNKETKKLLLGRPADIGKKKDRAFYQYALNVERKNLLIVDGASFSLIQLDANEFRSKRIGNFNFKDVAAFEIATPQGKVELKKEGENWKQVAPEASGKVNTASVESFLANYQGLAADKLIELNQTQNESALNLTNPSAVVTFKNASDTPLQTFKLGMTKEGVFIPMSPELVGQIGLDFWPELVPAPKLFTTATTPN